MTNVHLDSVLLLLEKMTLTEAEAERVHSAIQIIRSTSTAPATVVTSLRTTRLTDAVACPTVVGPPAENQDARASDNEDMPVVPPKVTVAILKGLPTTTVVIDGQKRYQKTYEGTTFDVPRADATGPFYLVTRGRRVGIFSTLQRTNPQVQEVKLASFSHASSLNDALFGMADAIVHHGVETVR